jgi:sarcosine oxidase gamma subunit
MPTITTPIARGPLVALHRRNGAKLEIRDGWEVAVRYPLEPAATANRVVDLSHRPTYEINGPATGRLVADVCGGDVHLRRIHTLEGGEVYRLTPGRAVLFGRVARPQESLDVTGGWASLALYGPDSERILNKITAVDLRERTLPVGSCCQGPIFGVNTLFGRFDDRFELHVCGDSAEFFWEVLFDAGREFELAPAGRA